MKILSKAFLALPALFLTPHAVAQEAATTAPVAAPAKVRLAKPALWKVSDADTTIYLFGTIHMLPKDVDWYRGPVKDSFLSSQELVLEMIEPDDATMAGLVMKKGMNPAGVTLRSMMSEADRTKYESAMKKLDLPAEGFDTMRPWLAGVTLAVLPLVKQGYDPESGVEKILEKERGDRRLVGLETAEQQLSFFGDLPDALSLEFLKEAVESAGEVDQVMPKMLNAWIRGDADTVGALVNESMAETPELAAALLVNRNMNWVEWIDTRLDQPGTVFIAVGAGHLAGRYSVNDMLKHKGIKVTRVQ